MSDDLADLFDSAPAGPSMDVRYRQGIVLAFDPVTLANTVEVGGTVCNNLAVLGVGEVTLLTPGSVVGIISVISARGTATWAILGRMVIPNTAEAQSATALLNSQIQADAVADLEATSLDTFGNLSTYGPAVTVNVRNRVLIIVTSEIEWVDTASAVGAGGAATVEMSGANTVGTAAAETQLRASAFLSTSLGGTTDKQGTHASAAVFENLNPGLTVVTMKYRSLVSGKDCSFGRRSLVAVAL